MQAVGYSEYGQPLQYTLPASAGTVWLTNTYDPQTHALTDVQTTDSTATTVVDDTSYAFAGPGVSKGAGLVTSATDKQNGGATTDTQCVGYDYAQRLSGAWTGTDGCATIPTPGNSGMVGGPSPYWQSWTYDTAGDRLTQVDHDTTGNTANDTTTTTYTYPPPATGGQADTQPHTLTSATATGPNAMANTASYTYDPSGNTTAITGGSTGNQTLTWTDQGKLATDTTSAGTSSYVYDAEGNLAVRRDPGQVTLFLGDQQLVLNTTTNTASGTRYYSLGGVTLAARRSTGAVQYLIPDRQGTDQLAIDSSTYTVTRRQYLPFGQPRGAAPPNWPGDLGYVTGTVDPATQLENLGAREYDPATGRFLSADPVVEPSDPTQLGGYDYAGNDPSTGRDPTGLKACQDGSDGRCSTCDVQACQYKGPDDPGAAPSPGGDGNGGGRRKPNPVTITIGLSFAEPCLGLGKACGEFPWNSEQQLAWQNFLENQKSLPQQLVDTISTFLGLDPNFAELGGKATEWLFAKIFGTAATKMTADAVVQSMVDKISAQGMDELKSYLKPRELAAYERNPAGGSRFLGQAMHRAVAGALDEAYRGMFKYRLIGPDFYVDETGEQVELTTPQQVAAHQVKPGYDPADGVMYVTYTLPSE